MDPIGKLAVTIGLAILHGALFTVVGMTISSVVFDIDLESMQDLNVNLSDPQSLNALMTLQILSTVGIFLMAAYMSAKLFSGNPNKYLSIDKVAHPKWFLAVMVLMGIALPLISFLGVVNAGIPFPDSMMGLKESFEASEESNQSFVNAFLSKEGTGALMLNLLMVAVLPAIGEEWMFRGVVQRLMVNWTKNIHWGIWIAAFVFSAFHFSFFGFLPRLILGAIFGYLLVWSKSMWVPVLAHFVNNAIAVFLAYYMGVDALVENPEGFGTGEDWMFLVGSIMAFAGLVWIMYRWRATDNSSWFDEEEPYPVEE